MFGSMKLVARVGMPIPRFSVNELRGNSRIHRETGGNLERKGKNKEDGGGGGG